MKIKITSPIPDVDYLVGLVYDVEIMQAQIYIDNECASVFERAAFESLPDFSPAVERISKPKKAKDDQR